jgi:hypothetical protein
MSDGQVFDKNDIVLYSKNGVEKMAKVVCKHLDDYPNLYYTIAFEDGNEKQTNPEFLSLVTGGASPAASGGGAAAAPPLGSGGIDMTMLSAVNFQQEQRALEQELKVLGEKSGLAQNLNGPITNAKKMVQNPDQVMFLARDRASGKAIGFIKFGPKDLFFYTKSGVVKSMKGQVCLLDFYVEDTVQRRGCGRALFDEMCRYLNNPPPQYLAYDRPSPKLLGFMAKHFGLTRPDLQPNKYTIFEGFPL